MSQSHHAPAEQRDAPELPDGYLPLDAEHVDVEPVLCVRCGALILPVGRMLAIHDSFHARFDGDGYLRDQTDDENTDLREALAEFLPGEGEELDPVPAFEPYGKILDA